MRLDRSRALVSFFSFVLPPQLVLDCRSAILLWFCKARLLINLIRGDGT